MPRNKQNSPNQKNIGIRKCPTGIKGFDEITGGGLPQGRPTLVVGGAGAGKTLFGMEFLVHGVNDFNEPGVFISFEETAGELAQNVASLGFDVKGLEAAGKLVLDQIYIERSEIEETGEYDLEGLFIRIGMGIDSIGAKRIVLDSIEALFSGLSNEMILRSELRRLFRWLKEKGVTAVITAEQGNSSFTRHGLEEYVSDAVIFLDHRIENQLSTRRLRVVKYRGSAHGTNEYPFMISENGFIVLPITSLVLKHAASSERISTGISKLDNMFGGKGYYMGSTILISGTSGSGKTSLAVHFVEAACQRGDRCLFYAYEESEGQIERNMRSIGIDLKPWIEKGLLRFENIRPATMGLETHLTMIHQAVTEFKPQVVVIDPLTDLLAAGSPRQVKAMLTRLIDFLKNARITAQLTSLTPEDSNQVGSEVGISSLIDTWLMVRNLEINGERTRGLIIMKSRGMSHSTQIREFILTDRGVDLVDVYLGPGGVLTGSARHAQEARDRADQEKCQSEIEHQTMLLDLKRKQIENQVAVLQAELASEEAATQKRIDSLRRVEELKALDRIALADIRQADE